MFSETGIFQGHVTDFSFSALGMEQGPRHRREMSCYGATPTVPHVSLLHINTNLQRGVSPRAKSFPLEF